MKPGGLTAWPLSHHFPTKQVILGFKRMGERHYFVYILSSKRYGTLYIGVTSNLTQRINQHKRVGSMGLPKILCSLFSLLRNPC